MSIASSAVKRLRGLYRVVFRRMRQHEARLFGGQGRAGVDRLWWEGVSPTCRIEQLEPRLMLDAVGPQVADHWPAGLVGPIDHIDISFNEPINPATLTPEGMLVMRSSPALLGSDDTAGSARDVTLAGNLAYVADYQSGLQILDITSPTAPVLLGGYDTAGRASAVAVSGTIACVADYTSGLQIIDVSDPTAPVRAGGYNTLGIAYGVAVSGTTAYVADFFRGLQVIDISDPAAPVLLGDFNTAGLAYGVTVSGTTAYVADRAAGLQIIDVSNPAAPVLLGTCDTAGNAYAVTVEGSVAYVADDTAGLAIIDVSDPAAPSLLGTYDTPGNAYDVSVEGWLAYVSDSTSGVQVIDVSDPASPTLLATYDTAGTAYGAAISGGLAYIADAGTGVQIIETRAAIASVTTPDGTAYRLSFTSALRSGDYNVRVYPSAEDVAGNPMDQDGDGIGGELPDDIYTFNFTVDATPPTAPGDLVFADDTGLSATDNLTSDTELVFTWSASTDENGIAGYEYRLDVGAWITTAALSAIVPVPEGEHTLEVRAVDGFGSTGPASSLVVTVDLTAPSAPTDVAVDGSVLSWDAVADANGIWKYQYRINGGDWIDTAGTQVNTGVPVGLAAVMDVRAVDKAGNAGAYASTQQPDYGPRVVSTTPEGVVGHPVDFIDITFNEPIDAATFTTDDVKIIPTTPLLYGYYDTPGSAHNTAVVGDIAYVADWHNGMGIFDVSDPSFPLQLGYYYAPNNNFDVKVVGTLAYLAGGYAGLITIDVSNPTAPVWVSTYDTPNECYSVQIVGNLAYTANTSSVLDIADISDPAHPVRVSQFTTAGPAQDVKVVGDLAYVTLYTSGLQIIDVSDPASPKSVGYYDTPNTARGIDVVGTTAYVADGLPGMLILDVSDPASPVLVGSFDTSDVAHDVKVHGNLAYIADGYDGLDIVDISDPQSPVLLNNYLVAGHTWATTVVDNLVYVSSIGGLWTVEAYKGVSGISQVDSNTWRVELDSPMLEGSYAVWVGPDITDLAGQSMDQDADGISGEPIQDRYITQPIIDVTPPSAPGTPVFSQNTGALAIDDITSDGALSFTWSESTDLNGIAGYEYRLDDGDWTSTTGPSAQLTVAEGDHLFEVRAVDSVGHAGPISSRPVIVDTTAPPAPTGLAMDGAALRWDPVADTNGIWKYQFRADGGEWTDSVDNLAGSGLADGVTAAFQVRAVDMAGNVGPVASATLTSDYGPRIVNATPQELSGEVDSLTLEFNEPINPATLTTEQIRMALAEPVLAGDWTGGRVVAGESNNLAYSVSATEGLQIFDLSDPTAPVLLGGYAFAGSAYDIAVAGNLAYVGDSEGLHILDVRNPAAPALLSTFATVAPAQDLVVSDNLAYVGVGSAGFQIIDVSVPLHPVGVAYYDTGSYSVTDIALSGTAFYLTRNNILEAYDVSDPSSPARTSIDYLFGDIHNVKTAGDVLFITRQNMGLEAYDISDRLHPEEIFHADRRDGTYTSIALVGTLAYVGASTGVNVYDIRDPAAIVHLGRYQGDLGTVAAIGRVGDYAYVVGNNSSAILHLTEPMPAVSDIVQVNPTTYRVDLSETLGEGWYHPRVLPGVTDLAGYPMDQNANGIAGEASGDLFAFSFFVDLTPPPAPTDLVLTNDTGPDDDNVTAATELEFSWLPGSDTRYIGGYEYRLDGGGWAEWHCRL